MTETQREKRLIGYARVSTFGQTLDSQLEQLRAAGCGSRNIYREKVTGARADRRELNRMLGKLGPGDVVTVTRIDRLARSTFGLFAMIILDSIINRTKMSEIIKGRGAYFLGRTDYDDIFCKSHTTKFCVHLYGGPWKAGLSDEMLETIIDRIDLGFNMCRRNNCADGECTEQDLRPAMISSRAGAPTR